MNWKNQLEILLSFSFIKIRMNQDKKKHISLAYIVTEKGCMLPNTGAFEHIKNGISELSKHFNLVSFLPEFPNQTKVSGKFDFTKNSAWYKQTGFWGMLRDIRDFINNWKQAKIILNNLAGSNCKIAYIRVQGLHPLPLILRNNGYMVFLEANGLQFENRRQYFKSSWLYWLYRPFEKFIYKKADHVFFVGSYGQYWKLDTSNWSEVENGIKPEDFPSRNFPACSKRPIKLVFLGKLTNHHNIGVLVDAIKITPLSYHKEFELHFIGSGLQNLKVNIPLSIKTIDHGFLERSKLGKLLTKMDIGLIPGGPSYNSQMKFMDYAAAGCTVIAANITHLKNFYDEHGVFFFQSNSPISLSNILKLILNGNEEINKNTNKLHNHIIKNYQWSKIFERKAACILSTIKLKNF